ncbi:hypothetical protein FBU30_002182, partial [Linnemannia zychae]
YLNRPRSGIDFLPHDGTTPSLQQPLQQSQSSQSTVISDPDEMFALGWHKKEDEQMNDLNKPDFEQMSYVTFTTTFVQLYRKTSRDNDTLEGEEQETEVEVEE